MTVHADLERAIAMAEAARGNYLLFAVETDEEKARQIFSDMAEDMKRHVMILESRKEYLEKQNPLNTAGQAASGGKQIVQQGQQKLQGQQGQQPMGQQN